MEREDAFTMAKTMAKDARVQTVGGYFSDGGEAYSLTELLIKLESDLGLDAREGKKLIEKCERVGFINQVDTNIYTR